MIGVELSGHPTPTATQRQPRASPRGRIECVIPWLRHKMPFPPLESALVEPNGLLAASDDLTPDRLIDAYRRGIFPWYSGDQPVLWWSPDPRMVLFIDEFRIARSLRKRIKQQRWEIRADFNFRAVINACALTRRARQSGTWITPETIDAYTTLHERGYAHSVEAWRDGRLAGGLYGVAIGRMFFGESMFTRETDASKVALAYLVARFRSSIASRRPNTLHRSARVQFGAGRLPSSLRDWYTRLRRAARGRPHRFRMCSRDQAQRSTARVAAVLRNCAIPLQLLAGPGCKVPGRNPQPPD